MLTFHVVGYIAEAILKMIVNTRYDSVFLSVKLSFCL